MKDAPRFSVCMPAYDAERHIGVAIESVLAQTVTDWELIVVDDASSDTTVEVARTYADPRIRIARNAVNLGPAANWNRSIDLATGTYVKVLCSDDLLAPTCLERQGAALDAHQRVVMVASRRHIIDDAGRILLRGRGLAGLSGRVDGRAAVRRMVRVATTPFGEPSVVLFRADALRSAGPFRADFGTLLDVDMYARVLARGDLFAIDDTLASFRVHPDSWSNASHGRQARSARTTFRAIASDESFGVSRLLLAQCLARTVVLDPARHMVFRLASLRR